MCGLGWPEPELQWYYVTDGGNWDEINNDDRHTINILLNHANILGTPQSPRHHPISQESRLKFCILLVFPLGTHERWFQMVIRAVVANDYGNYICEGRNDQGTGHATVRLFGEKTQSLIILT